MSKPPPTLLSIVGRRILAFACLAMVLQVALVLADYWFDDQELGRILIEHETSRIAVNVVHRDGALVVHLSQDHQHRYHVDAPGPDRAIFMRIRTPDGVVLYSNCDADCTALFFPLDLHPPTFWQRSLRPGKPLSVSGGRIFERDGAVFLVELAVLGDPNGLITDVLTHEMIDHMLVPMTLMLLLVIGAAVISIRQALAPVRQAAEAADRIRPEITGADLATERMPREIVVLVEAVNRLLVRVRALIRDQKLLASSIAHEIRTPVSIVKLELARIEDPRARRAEQDLDQLTHKLEQLTALARIDLIDQSAFITVDMTAVVQGAVERLAPYVYAKGKTIEFIANGPVLATAVPALIEVLVANLVENAVKHTPEGTEIRVLVGPGRLTVSDTGSGFTGQAARLLDGSRVKMTGALGLGLKIVERIIALHDWRIEMKVENPGTTAEISF
jgi:signal transduction histidine kinase